MNVSALVPGRAELQPCKMNWAFGRNTWIDRKKPQVSTTPGRKAKAVFLPVKFYCARWLSNLNNRNREFANILHIHEHICTWTKLSLNVCVLVYVRTYWYENVPVHGRTCIWTYLNVNVPLHEHTCTWTHRDMNVPVHEHTVHTGIWKIAEFRDIFPKFSTQNSAKL